MSGDEFPNLLPVPHQDSEFSFLCQNIRRYESSQLKSIVQTAVRRINYANQASYFPSPFNSLEYNTQGDLWIDTLQDAEYKDFVIFKADATVVGVVYDSRTISGQNFHPCQLEDVFAT